MRLLQQNQVLLTRITALKRISLRQFVSDIKMTSYASDSDTFLIDYLNCNKGQENVNLVNCNYNLPVKPFDTVAFNETPLSIFDMNMLYNVCI